MITTFLTDKDDVIRYDTQSLTEEEKAQARINIDAISMEEVEELLGIEEEFSATGDVAEFDFDVEPDTKLEVISKIHRDETWGLSNKLVLHQVSGTNFVDFSSYLGGAGTVFEKNGLTATINDDSTMTIRGTNEGTSNVILVNANYWTGEHSEKVYPAGTYTIPDRCTMNIRAAQYPKNVAITGMGNLSGTVTIPEPFRIIMMQYVVKAGATTNITVPLGLFRGNTIPETGYEYSGILHTVTFDTPVYDGEFNWSTGELKDADGNTVAYYDTPEIKRLPGTNYFWTCFGENTVSNLSQNNLEKVVIRLEETAPEETVPSICNFTMRPTTPLAAYCLHDDKVRNGGVFFKHEIPLITTKGTISVVNSDGEITTEKYVDSLINWQGVSDLLTNKGIHKAWSDKFYITKEPVLQEDFSDINNALYTFEFTEEDFQNVGIPAKLDNIPIVSPCFYTGLDAMSKLNAIVSGGVDFPATLSWDTLSGKYIFKVRGVYPGLIMHQLTHYTKCYFHYQLETPYDDSATFAMGISSGDKVTFTVDDSDWKTYVDAGLFGRDTVDGVDVTPNVSIFVPRNATDACGGMINAARMLNGAQSASGDVTVQGYSWIGEGDGITDYTAQIQSKIDELRTVSNGGTINLGPGTYPISGSLIVYGDTTIIGCGAKTVITQTADNTHAIVVNGSRVSIKDLSIKLSGVCTSLTGCIYVNSYNVPDNAVYNSALPDNITAQYLTIENIHMRGKYTFSYENGYAVISDAYDNYKGVGIYGDRSYFNFSHIENIKFYDLYAGIYGGGSANYFNVTDMSCRYGVYATGAALNTYFIDGHSFYDYDADGNHISMSDEIAHAEGDGNSTYHMRCFDSQGFKSYIYLGSMSKNNKVDIQTSFSSSGSVRSGHSWNILHNFIVDYGWANVYSDLYKHTPYHIGNRTTTIAGLQHHELSDPVIQNALPGAGIWGSISSNVEFTGYGMELKDVCRYPSEKQDNNKTYYLPYILSTVAPSEDNPIEIVIDYSNRPVIGLPNYFIQFYHSYVASDYVVSFDTTNTGVFDYVIPVTDNTNTTDYQNYPMASGPRISYRAKFSFTKALQISDLVHTTSGSVSDYNPNGLIGICNIGMTVNDYAGRSFLGECGGSLYGNVDMH
jgi:hypothetical protein